MARLIDADDLIERIEDVLSRREHRQAEVPSWLQKIIDELPTAYNVERVVEELEYMKKEETEGCSTIKGKYCSEYKFCGCCIIDRAIEIVRKGGVE